MTDLRVIVEDLRAASGSLARMTSGLAGYDLRTSNVDPDSFGHVELAAWMTAVAEQADKAGQALRDGAVALGEGLDATARDYERADQDAATRMRGLGGLGPLGPYGPDVGGVR